MASPFQALTAGVSPTIKGDPTIALIAQVNRFQQKYGQPEFPFTVGAVPIGVATVALGLLQARMMAAYLKLPDPGTATELQQIARAQGDPVPYVTSRLVDATRVIALYGDSLGLPPAKVGITSKAWTPLQWAIALAFALGGGFGGYLLYRHQKRLRAPA